VLYDVQNNKYYNCVTVPNSESDNYKRFTCMIYDEKGELVDPNRLFGGGVQVIDFKLFKMDNLDAPSYARVLKDGTCRIIWRDVLNNGFNLSDKTIEEYPFTNGAFYVNKGINLYVRRQDPYGIWGLYSSNDIFGSEINLEDEDNYVKENEIVC